MFKFSVMPIKSEEYFCITLKDYYKMYMEDKRSSKAKASLKKDIVGKLSYQIPRFIIKL